MAYPGGSMQTFLFSVQRPHNVSLQIDPNFLWTHKYISMVNAISFQMRILPSTHYNKIMRLFMWIYMYMCVCTDIYFEYAFEKLITL